MITALQKFKLNDIAVRHKFILLYVFAVLIPVIIANYIFYRSINSSVRAKQINDIKTSIGRVSINLRNSVDNCYGITDAVYNDLTLNNLMERKYESYSSYYDTFNEYLRNLVLKYLPMYSNIENITVYADNQTINDGGGYSKLTDKIKNEYWFDNAVKSNKNTIIETYYNNQSLLSSNSKERRLVMVRKLDNFKVNNNITKVLKIDLSYSSFNKILVDENIKGDMFVIDDKEKIIFSNDSNYNDSRADYVSFKSYFTQKGDMIFSNDLKGTLSGWKLVTVVPKQELAVPSGILSKYSLLIIITLIMPSIVLYIISKSFYKRLAFASKQIIKMEEENLKIIQCEDGKDEIGQLINEFNKMILKIKDLIEDVYKSSIQKKNLEIAVKQAKLNALQSQINPHFLFNTMETIRMRSLIKGEDETSDIIMYLSKMLRRSLSWDNDLIPIYEEVAFIEQFLKIQRYRFGEKLAYSIVLDEGIKNYKIPKISILTLVENACIHGVENIAEKGFIELQIKREKEYICIEVKDNGIGIEENKLKKLIEDMRLNKTNPNSIGLNNIYTRLYIYYSEKFIFNLQSKRNEGTKVSIKIPLDSMKEHF